MRGRERGEGGERGGRREGEGWQGRSKKNEVRSPGAGEKGGIKGEHGSMLIGLYRFTQFCKDLFPASIPSPSLFRHFGHYITRRGAGKGKGNQASKFAMRGDFRVKLSKFEFLEN